MLKRNLLALLSLVVFLTGCPSIQLSYYDTTTYQNLTDLKVDTTLLVQSFDTIKTKNNENRIETVLVNFKKAYEYEKGKGEPNSETMKQFNVILRLFENDIKEYREAGPGGLGRKYFQEAAIVLGQAFDIVIRTENLKNRGKP